MIRRYSLREPSAMTPTHSLVDHVVHDPAVRLVGHQHLEAVRVSEPADVEVLLHGVRGGQ
jgi:hypothetical protein